jgi:hypothetical protein
MKSIAGTSIVARRLIVSLFIALLAAGCASVSGTRDTVSVETARDAQNLSRAERVFLYQSRIADALLDHYPLMELFENADPAVIEAEARMTESCSHLTQAVLTRIEGDKPSLGLRFRVMATVEACEHAARKMDELLNATAVSDAI